MARKKAGEGGEGGEKAPSSRKRLVAGVNSIIENISEMGELVMLSLRKEKYVHELFRLVSSSVKFLHVRGDVCNSNALDGINLLKVDITKIVAVKLSTKYVTRR